MRLKELFLFTFTLCMAAFSLAGGQQHRRPKINPEAEMERISDPPAPPIFQLVSPGMDVMFESFNSVQVNVNSNGQNILGDAANEPSITVDPTNPNNISIAWRQFNSVNSNFRQSGYGYSHDAGRTWTFPGLLENNVFRSDPVLGTDASGKFYYLSLMQSFFDDIWSSTNGGQNWSRIAGADGGDKQWFTVDRTNSIGRGNLYQIWSTAGNNWGGRQFTRSVDGGATWMNPINIPNQPFWGTCDVGPNGEMYTCGTDQNGTLWFIRSSNAKDRTVTPTFDLVRSVNMGGQMSYGDPINPGGLDGQLWLAADRSGGPTNGNIYMLGPLVVDGSNPCDVQFVRSTDGGNSWSSPRRINDDARNQGRYHWFGTLSVAPNGRIDAVWYDTRNDSSNNTSQLFSSYSLDGGLTWSANQQISSSFNEHVGYPNQNKIGDYIGMVSDNTGANVAYSATFNGEEDVYFVRIPAPNVLTPDAFSIVKGTFVSGGLADLVQIDQSYLRVGAILPPVVTIPNIQVSFSAHSNILGPGALSLKFVAGVDTPGVRQKLSLYNFATNAYELVDSQAATTTDSTVTVVANGDLSRFVNSSTGEVRASVAYAEVNAVAHFPWHARFDQVQWTILP